MLLKSLVIIPFVVAAALGSQKAGVGSLDTEISRIEAWASDPDTRLVMISAMADDLKAHRNHLILVRKETGQTYGQIFVSSLEKSGLARDAIAARAAALSREVEQRLSPGRQRGGSRAVWPVLGVSTGVDHNSVGTFYWLAPEVGIDSRRASLSLGVPYYRNSKDTAAGGVGDAYAVGAVYGRVARTELEGALTLGFPTGDRDRGLGAGKVTADVTGTVAYRLERLRPFISAGFANSIFNFAYQRPFVSDGNAAHFSGGAEFQAARRLVAGFGGFAVRPFGAQVVYSRIMTQAGAPAVPVGAGGHFQGTGMPAMGGGRPMEHMPFPNAQHSAVTAGEIADHGANVWMSVLLARGLSLTLGVARSVPFHLTTSRFGLRFDVGSLLLR